MANALSNNKLASQDSLLLTAIKNGIITLPAYMQHAHGDITMQKVGDSLLPPAVGTAFSLLSGNPVIGLMAKTSAEIIPNRLPRRTKISYYELREQYVEYEHKHAS